MEFEGTRYTSRWDTSIWLLLLIGVLVCVWSVLMNGDWVGPVIMAVGLVVMFIGLFPGTYYRIDGDKLLVYQFFKPTALPIDKISEIRPTKTILAAPATSLTHRIAIKFSDRKVLKSSAPLVISPVRAEEFIAQLTAINPNIQHKGGGMNIRSITFAIVLAGIYFCCGYAEDKKASNFEFSNNRGSFSGTLTSSDSWQLEVGYHYMLCRFVGVGASVGLWKVYFEEGRAHGDDWEVDWDDDNNKPENFYLRPSLILKTPAIKIKSLDLGLYAEPGVMLNVPYAQVWVSQKIDRHRYESKRVWTNGGQWFAADLRSGVYLNVGPCGLSAGYIMSNHDVYSQFRSLSYRGVSFKRFYPRKPFMQGAYLTLSYYF